MVAGVPCVILMAALSGSAAVAVERKTLYIYKNRITFRAACSVLSTFPRAEHLK